MKKVINKKNKTSFPAVFKHNREEGCYDVSFPDFPGCVTFGYSFKEAKEKAKEVLELWIEELISQNQLVRC